MSFDHTYFKSFGGQSFSVDMASDTEEELCQEEEREVLSPASSSSREYPSSDLQGKKKGTGTSAILVASEPLSWFRNGGESFSIQPFTDSEDVDLPEPAPELRIYEEDSSQKRASEKKETEIQDEPLLDLEGNPVSGLPPLGSPSDFAQPVSISSWPRDLLRLYEKGENAFSELATTIQRDMARGMKILGFGSAAHGAGTTSLILGLVREMVLRHYSLLVIDADFEQPSIAEKLGIIVDRGWEEFLPKREGESPRGLLKVSFVQEEKSRRFFPKKRTKKMFSDSSVRLEKFKGDAEFGCFGDFYLLPLQRHNIVAAATVSGRRLWLARFLELAEFFDLVLIDHGLLATHDDTKKIEELLRFGGDGWYLVDDVRQHRTEAARKMIEQTAQCDFPCLGIIENFI